LGGDQIVSHDFPESDWKIFRQLRELALERFCERVLDEIESLRLNASRNYHERYLDVFRFLQERDEKLGRAFNDPRRSQMIFQLAAMHADGLLEPNELARFSPRTRATVELLAKELAR
jgi:hypothetical protein